MQARFTTMLLLGLLAASKAMADLPPPPTSPSAPMKTASLVLLAIGSLLVVAGITQVFRRRDPRGRALTRRRFLALDITMIGAGVALLALGAWFSN
jgi:hypothetical protein